MYNSKAANAYSTLNFQYDSDLISNLDIQDKTGILPTSDSTSKETPLKDSSSNDFLTAKISKLLDSKWTSSMTKRHKSKSKKEQGPDTKVHNSKRMRNLKSPDRNWQGFYPLDIHKQRTPGVRWPIAKDETDDTDPTNRQLPLSPFMSEICRPVSKPETSSVGRPYAPNNFLKSRYHPHPSAHFTKRDETQKPDSQAQVSKARTFQDEFKCYRHTLPKATSVVKHHSVNSVLSLFRKVGPGLFTKGRPMVKESTQIPDNPDDPLFNPKAGGSSIDKSNPDKTPQRGNIAPIAMVITCAHPGTSAATTFITPQFQITCRSNQKKRDIMNHRDSPAPIDTQYSNLLESTPCDMPKAGAIRLVSLNVQRRHWINAFDRCPDLLLIQESKYVQSSRFPMGYILESPDRELITWSRHPMITLKNLNHIQATEVKIRSERLILINLHLSNHPKTRNSQLQQIEADIQHIKLNYAELNLIVAGDFNTNGSNIESLPLTRYPLDANTWRKNGQSEYTTQIDHVLFSPVVDIDVTTEDVESDHRALIIDIKSLGRCAGI